MFCLHFLLTLLYCIRVRDVAQLVERLVWDQEAASSSPAVPTISYDWRKQFACLTHKHAPCTAGRAVRISHIERTL